MGDEDRKDRWGEQVFGYLAAKRNDKRGLLDFELKLAVDAGEHVHMLDTDGEWCLGDCDIPLRPGMKGAVPSEVIWDEIAEFPPGALPDWCEPEWNGGKDAA